MLIGEAPGREEDDAGRPFIGGAGRVLAALLGDAGVLKTDCYLSNVCRCRPPNNRTPELDEIFACQDYLAAEIKRVNPDVIVALGDTAAMLCGGHGVNTHRGAIVQGIGPAAGRPVLITYHPAFVMRMRSMFPVVAWDLRKARLNGKVDNLDDSEYIYTPSRSEVEQVFQHILSNNLTVAVDIETAADKEGNDKDALDPYKGEVIGIAFAWGKGKALQLDATAMLKYSDLLVSFLSKCEKQIYANHLFDRTFLAVKYGIIAPIYIDVQDYMGLIYHSLPRKLDFLRSIYTTIPPYKTVYKERAGGKYQPSKLSSIDLARLNCQDVDVTWQVAQAQLPFIPECLHEPIRQQQTMALEMRLKGIYIDTNNLAAHYATLLPRIEQLENDFQTKYGVMVSSPEQLSRLLYDRLGINPPSSSLTNKQTGKSRKYPSNDEKTIQEVAHNCGLSYIDDEEGERFEGESTHKDVLADILVYRGLSKQASTYCESTYKLIGPDGRLHPEWKVLGTPNGRWSCVKPGMQTFPKEMRDVVRAGEGNILFGADYKGMQIIGAALLAEDWDLVEKMMLPDYSLHDEVMEAIRPS